MQHLSPPEILAPVGNWEMCLAAVHNGAGAVYLGFPYFNARGRTQDFSIDGLKKIIDYCHLYNVRVFLALNVLVFEKELQEIEEALREVIALGPDAFIIQDIGLVRLIKKLAPWQEVHASTQMTISCGEAIALTQDLDIKRYVLAREVSIIEMQKIRNVTSKELEVFVHGALCVSYSGQCLTSESNGGRSANRGQCAQSCRLAYDLFVDGEARNLGEKRFLVSPQDLCGLDDIPRLVQLGIDSFKIEGRLKSPEYVATTVKNYSEVTQEAFNNKESSRPEERKNELALSFARGRFNGWLDGVNHQRLVDARFSRPNGISLGKIVSISDEGIEVPSQNIKLGDGVLFCDFQNNIELGGIVFGVKNTDRNSQFLWLGREFNHSKLYPAMEAFYNSSQSFENSVKKSFLNKENHIKVSLTAKLTGEIGQKLVLTIRDNLGNVVEVQSKEAIQASKTSSLTKEDAQKEIGALYDTAFQLKDFSFEVKGACFVHNKLLKELRREAVTKLLEKRQHRDKEVFASSIEIQDWKNSEYANYSNNLESTTKLSVLIREDSQLEALKDQDIDTVYLDYEYNKDYEHSLDVVRSFGYKCGIATTRIMKPGELGHLKYIERLKPDCILVRNLGAIQYYLDKDIELRGDFSLNITNSLSAAWFIQKGLKSISPSYDLNQWQLDDLLKTFPTQYFEITVHQYMPGFHMEHCVFAAFLSKGTSYKDCGRPCEKHKVELRDSYGVVHPLKADAECRNTMFQGKPQAALRLIPDLISKKVGSIRIEALFESVEELRTKIAVYSDLIQEKITVEQASLQLGLVERYGVTEGQLFNAREYVDRKKTALTVL
jgi:U32 family peptidase